MNTGVTSWSARSAFAGFDWAREHHDIVVVSAQGVVVEEFRIEESAEGWQRLREKFSVYPEAAVAVETRSGMGVERLLETGCAVFPVNPKSAQRYRERKAPRGTKTNRVDAWSLADALRLDGHTWRRLLPDDPLTVELRRLCRDEIPLIGQRTARVCQLRAALHEYYPAALSAFDDWTTPSSWTFIERFPTSQHLVAAGKRRREKFLHVHKRYPSEALHEKRLAVFAAAESFCGSAAVTNAKSLLAVTLSVQWRTLQKHLDAYRRKITELFDRHPDHDLFGSLPGAGEKLAPRLLAELGDDRGRFDSAEGLPCYAGTAPVNDQSGPVRKSRIRRACQKALRGTVPLGSDLSRRSCPWAQAYDRQKREQGKSHACALRCLGQRWLKILWKMWQTRTAYDAEQPQRNPLRHGSWVLALVPAANPSAPGSQNPSQPVERL